MSKAPYIHKIWVNNFKGATVFTDALSLMAARSRVDEMPYPTERELITSLAISSPVVLVCNHLNLYVKTGFLGGGLRGTVEWRSTVEFLTARQQTHYNSEWLLYIVICAA